jgi:ribosomal protein S18 acetylase RimI-like enzyme
MQNPINIQPASAADAGSVVRLVQELAHNENESCDLTEAFVLEYLAFPGSNILLAWDGDQVVGLLSFSVRPGLYHAGQSALIEELVVQSSARSHGVGGLLIDEVVKRTEALGCKEISVSTMADNTGAIRFYVKHGFEEGAVYLERHFSGSDE